MMRSLDLDLIARRSAARLLGGVFLLWAVGAWGYALYEYRGLNAKAEIMEAKWRSLHRASRRENMPAEPRDAAEREKRQAEVRYANNIVRRFSLPWNGVFEEIDASVGDDVALLSVEPDTEKRELRVAAEAKDFNAMLDYIGRLQAGRFFRDSHVISHQIQQQDPQRPVRFMLVATWAEGAAKSEKSK